MAMEVHKDCIEQKRDIGGAANNFGGGIDVEVLTFDMAQNVYNISIMTVCIAAIADKGKKIILAADDMMTAQVGTSGFQKQNDGNKKIYELNNQTWALGAGTTPAFDAIIKSTKNKIGVNSKPANVANHIKESYTKFYLDLAEDSILKKRDLTWEKYNKNQKDLDPQTVKMINDEINAIKPDVFIIVAGYSKEDNNEVYLGTVGGYTLVDRTSEGFCTTGNGADLAKYSLLLSDYNTNLPLLDAEVLIKKAVEAAGKAPGVGKLGEYLIVPK